MQRTDSNYVYYLVARNIKKYRKLKGITQQELADMIGYSVGFISNIESKSYLQTFSLDTLYIISLKLGVNIKDLFDEEKVTLWFFLL